MPRRSAAARGRSIRLAWALVFLLGLGGLTALPASSAPPTASASPSGWSLPAWIEAPWLELRRLLAGADRAPAERLEAGAAASRSSLEGDDGGEDGFDVSIPKSPDSAQIDPNG